MKIIILLVGLLLTFIVNNSYAQSVHVKMIIDLPGNDNDTEVDLSNKKDIEVPQDFKESKEIKVKSTDLPEGHKLIFTIARESKVYDSPPELATLKFENTIIDKEIIVKHIDDSDEEVKGDEISLRLVLKEEVEEKDDDDDDDEVIQPSIEDFLSSNYSDLYPTPFGYIKPGERERIIHIFFDQHGNSLLSTVPQGISNAQYMVHIIYPISTTNPNRISYSVKQKSGTFSTALLFNNTNVRSKLGQLQGGEKFDAIVERTFLLGTATDDLTFDIISKEGKSNKVVLESYTIKMSPVYHGSFDVGLIKTNLQSPTFSLVQSPTTSDMVVKVTDESPKGVVTVMASFYVSPVILLKSLRNRFLGRSNIPFYKLTGRSFLDDHKIYERFYPTVGVSVSGRTFENIFYGINWEIARGLAIFGGWHYGKVNTFEMPDFRPGETVISEKQFEFYQRTRWKTSTSIGVKLDILIIRNLFTAGGDTQ
ncbi:hypothetical protein [Larkinella arboricola]